MSGMSAEYRDKFASIPMKPKVEKINRLKNNTVYLAGAIDRVADSGHGWRNDITPFLSSLGINVLNPLKKPISVGLEGDDYRYERHILKQEGRYADLAKIMKRVRNVDLRMVDKSDFLIVSIDMDVALCGTYEEIFWANRQKKPILIKCEQGVRNLPDWLFGCIPHQFFFNSWDSLIAYVRHVDSSEEQPEHHKRWFFFNYEDAK